MQDKTPLIQFLQASQHIDGPMALMVAEMFQPLVIPKDGFLLREGQISDTYYFLGAGWMRGHALSPNGQEVTTGIYAPRSVVFEVHSFFNRQPSRENIQAISECMGWCITFAELNHLFHSHQAFREFGRAVLVRGFSALKGRMLSMVTETGEERYAALLKHHPEIFQHVPLKHIASYLGVTDSSLSRIRREFAHR